MEFAEMKCFILFTHWWFSFSIFRLLWFLCLSISLLSLLHACLIFVLCFLCNNWNCIYDTCTHTFSIFFLLFFFFFLFNKRIFVKDLIRSILLSQLSTLDATELSVVVFWFISFLCYWDKCWAHNRCLIHFSCC